MSRVWHATREYYLLLPLGVAVALAWANADAESYFEISQRLSFAVNVSKDFLRLSS